MVGFDPSPAVTLAFKETPTATAQTCPTFKDTRPPDTVKLAGESFNMCRSMPKRPNHWPTIGHWPL
jgi:hypothetical protein